jgi:gluconate 5-dehydrogenase
MTAGSIANMGGESVLVSKTPLRRVGGEDDLKGVALLLSSDAGKHITGQWISVDGGASVVIM